MKYSISIVNSRMLNKRNEIGSIAKGETGLKERICVRDGVTVYFVVNIFFLLPIVFLNEFKPDGVPVIYIVMLILYYLLQLTYIHLIGNFGMLLYNIYKLVKEKSLSRFFWSFCVLVLDVALNIYWIINGYIYTIQ